MITNHPQWEALKEIARLGVLFAISFILVETLNQITVVPQTYTLQVLGFEYALPIRAGLQLALVVAGRYVDKLKFEATKANPSIQTKGLLPF